MSKNNMCKNEIKQETVSLTQLPKHTELIGYFFCLF